MRQRPRAPLLAALVALAACGDLPQPFRHEGLNHFAAPQAPRGVVVHPVMGDAPGPALAEAMVARLVEDEVPATLRDAASGAWVVDGVLDPHDATGNVVIAWALASPGGEVQARYVQKVAGAAWASAEPRTLKALAAEAVVKLSPPLHGESLAASDAAAAVAAPRVRLVPPAGLPGDGDNALAAAMRRMLEANGLMVVAEGGDYVASARATVIPGRPGEDILDVAWMVNAATGGAELGTAAQSGAVPKGRLNGPWGSLARDIAAGGAEGVLQIVRAAGAK